MIVINMDLLSAISETRNARLASIGIANDGTSKNRARGNYDYKCFGRNGRCIKQGRIENWPRQAKTPLALLQAVLNDAYPERKK